jgi:dihydrofolate synthase/folylpolyglutamate synthase
MMSDVPLLRFEALFGPEFGHGKAFDIDRLKHALTALSFSARALPPVFHVAGTNGKGSTIAFLRAIAEADGLRVHAFTKPHLFALRERFTIAGETVSDEALISIAERIAAADSSLTQFDAQVAAALLLFAETPADLALLETGMGGRDDSTNILTPALSIITPIGLDHQDALGATLAEITAHKAGILKPRTPAITARQPPDTMQIIEKTAKRVNAPLWRQGVEWDAFANSGKLVVQTQHRTLDLPLPSLFGAHQIENAGIAAAAFLASPFNMTDEAFAQGVRAAHWPARLQPIKSGALAAPILATGGEVWVDGGHNAHAAEALARALAELNRKRPAPVVLIVGLRARKDARAFIAALAPNARRVVAVPLKEDHVAPDEIAAHARAAGIEAHVAPSLEAAIKSAAQLPAPRVLICGSLLLAAEALSA